MIQAKGGTGNPVDIPRGAGHGRRGAPGIWAIFINEVGKRFDKVVKHPLQTGTTSVNMFLYAGDLIMIANYHDDLQNLVDG